MGSDNLYSHHTHHTTSSSLAMPQQQIEAPEGLQEFLQSFVVAILRQKPDDLLEFSSGYFQDLLDERNAQANDSGMLPGMSEGVSFQLNRNDDAEWDAESQSAPRVTTQRMMMKTMSRTLCTVKATTSDDASTVSWKACYCSKHWMLTNSIRSSTPCSRK